MPLYDKMTLPLTCGHCGHQWVEEFMLPMKVKEFVPMVQSWHCPRCGQGHRKLTAAVPEGGAQTPPAPAPGWGA